MRISFRILRSILPPYWPYFFFFFLLLRSTNFRLSPCIFNPSIIYYDLLLSLILPSSSLHRRIHSGCRCRGGENPRSRSTWSNSNPEFLPPRARRRRKGRLQIEGRRRDGLLGVIVVLSGEITAGEDSSDENGCWASTGFAVRSLFVRPKRRENQPLSRLLQEGPLGGGESWFVEAMVL